MGDTVTTTETSTAVEPYRRKIPQPHGGALNGGGTPGNKGGRGYPSKFLEALHAIPERAKIPEVVAGIISGDILEHLGDNADGSPIVGETRNSDRLKAIEYVTDRVLGKPAQPVAIGGDLTFHLVRE